jgi:hypothetical protein
MRATEAIQRVASQLSDGFTVAAKPDHPYLLRGPDVLAGAKGNLIAVFVLTVAEQRSVEQFIARTMLSRLALPAHARFVLVAPGRELPARTDARVQTFASGVFFA